jgi:hypothetical protein
MPQPIRILLQTTIPEAREDWHVGRFSLLAEHLEALKSDTGEPLCRVTARNRKSETGPDPVLSALDTTDFDELWLFAVDTGHGLTLEDCQGITRFRQRGGGVLSARDHQDLGSSLCSLGEVGRAHFFHSKYPDPDESRRVRDDQDTKTISWPNYHSGSNGDYQRITCVDPIHPLLRNPNSASGAIEYFPAHPHEGGVGVPEGEDHVRVIATGMSQVTHRPFNLIVAFEHAVDEDGNLLGRAIAESSFHHFADYNWDTNMGCPSFVTEPPGDELREHPERLNDIKTYVRNAALWLGDSARR